MGQAGDYHVRHPGNEFYCGHRVGRRYNRDVGSRETHEHWEASIGPVYVESVYVLLSRMNNSH